MFLVQGFVPCCHRLMAEVGHLFCRFNEAIVYHVGRHLFEFQIAIVVCFSFDEGDSGGLIGISLPSGLDWYITDFALALYGFTLVALPHPLDQDMAR